MDKKKVLNEEKLRSIVRMTVVNMIRESFGMNDDDDIKDDWYAPDEFDTETIGEPTDADIELEPMEKPENLTKAEEKRRRAAEIIRNILAKQGYKGDKLESEVEKRLGGKSKSDSSRRRPDSFYDNSAQDVWFGNQNLGYVDSGVAYNDDDFDLNEAIKRISKKVISELKH